MEPAQVVITMAEGKIGIQSNLNQDALFVLLERVKVILLQQPVQSQQSVSPLLVANGQLVRNGRG